MTLIKAITTGLAVTGALLPAARAGFNPLSSNNVVVYWGQNSVNHPNSQERLSHYCKDEKLDIIPLAFLTNMGDLDTLNFANRAPSELENDIRECQEVHKKTIVLSLGGEVTNGAGFSSEEEATQMAQQLWAAFGPVGASSANRKFGKAVVDGFDFDNEKPIANIVPFARELRRQMTEASKKDGKNYLLTAAPQCVFPDLNVGPVLESDVALDAIFIQFYNNPECSVTAFVPGLEKQPKFNFELWADWAKKSKNPDVKVLVGVPSTPGASTNGFVPAERLAEIVTYCNRFPNFGGIMFWDMSQTWTAPTILTKVRSALGGSKRPVAPTVQAPWPAPVPAPSPSQEKPAVTSVAKVTQVDPPAPSIVAPLVFTLPKPAPPPATSSVKPIPRPVQGNFVVPVASHVQPSPPQVPTTMATKTKEAEPSPAPDVVNAPEPEVVKAEEKTTSEELPSPTPGQIVEIVWKEAEPGLVHQWNQCGGEDWNGGHTCEDPYLCKYFSNWYSQCEEA